jgi:NADPH:quinone reductase-like Zn-dependent oxidoreductase/aryl carrier-like protein
MTTTPGSALDVCAALSPSGPRSGSVDVAAFYKDTPVVTLRGQKFQGIAASMPSTQVSLVSRPLHNVRMPLRMTVATPGVVSSLCFAEDEAAKASLRPDEVEIKALAFTLSAVDVDVILGRNSDSASVGECAGIITAVGSDLTHSFRIGERVCAWDTNVAFATCTRVKGSFVQKIPESWSFKLAAALPQNLSLAYHALRNCAQLESGQTVLINGAGGALGHAVALLANFLGLVVVATVQTKAEKQALESFHGIRAAHILYSGDAALAKALLRLTGGTGVDAVVNSSPSALTTELVESVRAFGTVVDLHPQSASLSITNRAVRYISFDAGQLLRHLPSTASYAFKTVLSLLPDDAFDSLMPIIAVPISDAVSAFKAVQSQKNIGKTVLLADEDALVNVKEAVAQTTSLAHVNRIIQIVSELSVPQEQKEALYALIKASGAAATEESPTAETKSNSSATANGNMKAERRLAAATSMKEARSIVLAEQIKKMSSLVSVSGEELDPREPLADLGLDSLIAIEFKNWLGRSLGADIRVHDILDADGLGALADLVAQKSKFVPEGLSEEPSDASPPKRVDEWQPAPIGGRQTSKLQKEETSSALVSTNTANGTAHSNGYRNAITNAQKPNSIVTDTSNTNGQTNGTSAILKPNGAAMSSALSTSSQSTTREYRFTPNELPKFPLPPLDALMDAYLTGVKAFATPEEFKNTVHLAEDFKQPGSKGRLIYERAASRHADPKCENWVHELEVRRNFLDRRASLVPSASFWFSHPISERQHSQAERAALLTFAAGQFKLKLDAGLVKPVVLNEQELTTAFHPYIFNTVRVPRVGSDEMERYPGTDHCVVFWRGHGFKLDLSVGGRSATFEDLYAAFRSILSQDLQRSNVSIFTSHNRHSWAEAREALQQLNPINAATIAAIESSAFVVALDEATPVTATERARQFHFGGKRDAANRWHDKSIQFVICSNGTSGILGEHTKLDALTLNELLADQITAIRTHNPVDTSAMPPRTALMPEFLPLTTDAALDTHMVKAKKEFVASTADGEHAYLLFEDYGSGFLRVHKLSPKSVFQMIVQLAALETFGYTPPCWETVNQAHYHLGRVDIIQVVVPAVAAFVQAARDASVSLSQRRALLVDAIRAHVNTMNKAGRNLGWERNLSALRALAAEPHELPDLYKDPVYDRVRPRVMMSNCFETGMMEKGCLWKHIEAVWLHYEVYDASVYFSVVTLEAQRATRFCEHLKEAAALVKQIVLA